GLQLPPVCAATRPAELDAAARRDRKPRPLADLGVDLARRDDLPVPALPGVHQLHQPDATRLEPRPPAAGVVRTGQRAAARAAERDPRDARIDCCVPLLPELQRIAEGPRYDREQAQP